MRPGMSWKINLVLECPECLGNVVECPGNVLEFKSLLECPGKLQLSWKSVLEMGKQDQIIR